MFKYSIFIYETTYSIYLEYNSGLFTKNIIYIRFVIII
jgi:hypothetical protein